MPPRTFPKLSRNLLSGFVVALVAIALVFIWLPSDKLSVKERAVEATKESDKKAIGEMLPGNPDELRSKIAEREKQLEKEREKNPVPNETYPDDAAPLARFPAGRPDGTPPVSTARAGNNPAANLPVDGVLRSGGASRADQLTAYDQAKAESVRNASASSPSGGFGVWEGDFSEVGNSASNPALKKVAAAGRDGAINAMGGVIPENLRPGVREGAVPTPASSDTSLLQQAVTYLQQMNSGEGKGAAGGAGGTADRVGGSAVVDNNTAFMKRAAQHSDGVGGGEPISSVKPAPSKYFLRRDSAITCTLQQEINTDSPGDVSCLVAENIYDSICNCYLLIPQGSWLHGIYDAAVMPGQNYILMAFQELSYPSGATVPLGAMRAGEANGRTGLRAEVDNHFLKVFGSSFLVAGVARAMTPKQSQVSINVNSSEGSNPAGQVLLEIARQMAARNAAIKPTLSREWASTVTVLVNKHLVLPPADWKKRG